MIVSEVRVETCDNCASLEAKNAEFQALLREVVSSPSCWIPADVAGRIEAKLDPESTGNPDNA